MLTSLFENQKSPSTLSQIVDVVEKLSREQQGILLKELKKNLLIEKANALKGSVKNNNITMAEIVKICKEVRKQQYAKAS